MVLHIGDKTKIRYFNIVWQYPYFLSMFVKCKRTLTATVQIFALTEITAEADGISQILMKKFLRSCLLYPQTVMNAIPVPKIIKTLDELFLRVFC